MERKRQWLQPLPTWADDRLRWLYKSARLVLDAYEAGQLATIPRVSPFATYHEQLYRDREVIHQLERAYTGPDARQPHPHPPVPKEGP